MILKSNNTTSFYISNKKSEAPHITSIVHCVQNNKHMSWMSYAASIQTILIIDPPFITKEIIDFIERNTIKHIFIILTSSQRKKKDILMLWNSIYPITIITPETTFYEQLTLREHILNDNVLYNLACSYNGSEYFLGSIIGANVDDNCLLFFYCYPYLFSGVIMQSEHTLTNRYAATTKMNNFIATLPENSIILPEIGVVRRKAQ